jgi:hypothetical protein
MQCIPLEIQYKYTHNTNTLNKKGGPQTGAAFPVSASWKKLHYNIQSNEFYCHNYSLCAGCSCADGSSSKFPGAVLESHGLHSHAFGRLLHLRPLVDHSFVTDKDKPHCSGDDQNNQGSSYLFHVYAWSGYSNNASGWRAGPPPGQGTPRSQRR